MKRVLFSAILGLMFLPGYASAQSSIKQLFAFNCQPYPSELCADGAQPHSIFQSSDGNFYGVTNTSYAAHGTTVVAAGGTIFKITESGQITVLYTFKRNTATGWYDQGSNPAALVEASDGFLYGVASTGGPNGAAAGNVFKISKTGTGFQILQSFCTTCTNGGFPNSLVVGTDGNLYGTTGYGGTFPSSGICGSLGCGAVFRLTPPGTYTVLHRLNGTTESSVPLGVTQASDGNLYGTTGEFSVGTIFRVIPSNSQFATLYTFPSGTFPLNSLIQASNGLLYGTTRPTYATNNNFPVGIFTSTLEGAVETLQQINFPATKGFSVGPFLQASDGNLWTTSSSGGSTNWGTAFSVTLAGGLVDTLSFSTAVDVLPTGGVIQSKDGTLLGTTTNDGTNSQGGPAFGTIYTISGLPPKK